MFEVAAENKTKGLQGVFTGKVAFFYVLGSPHVASVVLHIPARCLLPSVQEYTAKKKKKSGLFVMTVDCEKQETNDGGRAL